MVELHEYECAVCGERRSHEQFWFLIAESAAEKIRILAWHDDVASRRGVSHLCSTAHVREMVVNWMAGIEPTFLATDGLASTPLRDHEYGVRVVRDADTQGARELAELSIDREAVGRPLSCKPESLLILLDEMSDALDREARGAVTRLESGNAISWFRQL